MTLVRIWPDGASGDIDPIKFGMLAVETSKAVDGYRGGWYSPIISPIYITGSGFGSDNIGDSTLEGSLQLSGVDAHWQWRLDRTSVKDDDSRLGQENCTYHSVVWTGPHIVRLNVGTIYSPYETPLRGDRIRIRHGVISGNHVMDLRDENDTLIAELTPGAGNDGVWIECIFTGTTWITSAWNTENAATILILQ